MFPFRLRHPQNDCHYPSLPRRMRWGRYECWAIVCHRWHLPYIDECSFPWNATKYLFRFVLDSFRLSDKVNILRPASRKWAFFHDNKFKYHHHYVLLTTNTSTRPTTTITHTVTSYRSCHCSTTLVLLHSIWCPACNCSRDSSIKIKPVLPLQP